MTDENETRPSGGTGAGSTELQECNPNDTRAVSRSEFLGLLGHGSGVFTALAELAPTPGAPFVARVVDSTEAAGLPANLSVNEFIGICPVAGPARRGRGSADDVTALPAIWADLDVKPGACPSLDVAEQIITALGVALGTEPTMTTRSGSGLHPYWPIDDEAAQGLDDEKRERVALLLRRWGTAVAKVATAHGASVDNVYDLARVMRAPGSINLKNGTVAPVVCERGHGAPIALDQLVEACEVLDVPEVVADPVAEPVQASGWADKACRYSVGMVAGWATDVPNAGRHPWLMGQATRLEAARINGCLTADGYREARAVLAQRFGKLCERGIAGDRRPVGVGEVSEAFSWASIRAAAKSADQIAAELGRHFHDEDLLPEVAPAPTTPPGDAVELTTVLDGEIDEPNRPLDWVRLLTGPVVPIEWLIADVVAVGRSYALVATAKAGKSLLALDLVIRHGVRCLYLDAEQTEADVRARLLAMGATTADLDRLNYVLFPSIGALDTVRGGQQLAELVDKHRPELVVIDTVGRFLQGDENEAATIQALYRNSLMGLKRRKVAVLRLDHLGKDATKGQRGSSAKSDDVDAVWMLTETKAGERYTLRCERQRSGDHPAYINVRRLRDPLRHELSPAVEVLDQPLDKVAQLVAELDRLGVPIDLGRDRVRPLLVGKWRNEDISAAIRQRRERGPIPVPAPVPDLSPTISTKPVPELGTGQGKTAGQTCPGQVGDRSKSVQGGGLSPSPLSREGTGQPGPGEKSRRNWADPPTPVKPPVCEGCGSRVSSPTIQLCNNCARAEQ